METLDWDYPKLADRMRMAAFLRELQAQHEKDQKKLKIARDALEKLTDEDCAREALDKVKE